jgi:hypothetical protein
MGTENHAQPGPICGWQERNGVTTSKSGAEGEQARPKATCKNPECQSLELCSKHQQRTKELHTRTHTHKTHEHAPLSTMPSTQCTINAHKRVPGFLGFLVFVLVWKGVSSAQGTHGPSAPCIHAFLVCIIIISAQQQVHSIQTSSTTQANNNGMD